MKNISEHHPKLLESLIDLHAYRAARTSRVHHILPQQLRWCCIVTTLLNYEMPHSTMCYEILWKIDVVRWLVVGLLFSSRLVRGLSVFPK